MVQKNDKNGCVIYRDPFGGWRWEWCGPTGQMQDSMQSYDSREDCIEAAVAAGVYGDATIAAVSPSFRKPDAARVVTGNALIAARKQQLKYWQDECAAAQLSRDTHRIERCERLIKQCEVVIAALERAAKH